MSRPLEDFYAGLTTIRPWMLVASALLAAAMLAGLEVALSRGLVWKLPVEWVLSTRYDDWSHASWQVSRLRIDPDPTPAVVLIGGSAAREAVAGNAAMSRALSEGAGKAMRFVNLGTRNQTLAEALLLVDQLPRVTQGLVVFSVHPMFLRDGPEDWSEAARGVRFPLLSPALSAAMAEIGPDVPTGSNWRVLRFRPQVGNWVSKRVAQRAVFKPLTYIDHLYENKGPMGNVALKNKLVWIQQRLPQYTTYRDDNLKFLSRAVSLAKEKGYRVALLDLPRNPVADRLLFAPLLPDYTAALSSLARDLGVSYLDMHGELDFKRRDFYDHIHFLTRSRPRFEKPFIAHLLRLQDAS